MRVESIFSYCDFTSVYSQIDGVWKNLAEGLKLSMATIKPVRTAFKLSPLVKLSFFVAQCELCIVDIHALSDKYLKK